MSESPDRQQVIEKYLQGLHHHEDGYSHGYLNSDDELMLFESSLAAVNERYAVRTSRDLNKPSKPSVVFSMIHSGCRIALGNVPFRVVKETVKVCIYGMEYYKKTPEKKEDEGSSTTDWPKEVHEKKRMNRQGTKKKGCAATMNLKWIELYPDFQVDLPQPCGQTKEGRLKADKAKQLQDALDAEQQTVAKETRVYVRIADCGSHSNHGFEDMEAFSHNMGRNIAKRIQMSAREGTNNGIEAQNRVLKAQYVKSASGKRSLTSLIGADVHGYLSTKEVKFREPARRQSSVCRQYSENIPAYLHNRPHGFVKHMLRRLVNAEEYNHTDMKELPIEGMFSVHSERSDDDVYIVDFTKPSCTCPDFRKHKYPCKHFCVVFQYSDRWGFSSLPQSYLNQPQITLGSCLESETGSEIPLVSEPSPSEVSSQALGTEVSEPDILFVDDLSYCQVPLQPVVAMVPGTAAPSVSELRKRITEELEKCSSLLHCCHDVQTLSEVRGLLQVTFRKLAESVPQSSGLHIRGLPTKRCSSLKPLPKRRRL